MVVAAVAVACTLALEGIYCDRYPKCLHIGSLGVYYSRIPLEVSARGVENVVKPVQGGL